jgi:hypothetical protein
MTAWVLTKELNAFRTQMDVVFPHRDHASDGAVGDLAHQNEAASGHNPDRTGRAEYKDGDSKNEVRAIDVDSDTGDPDISMEDIVQHLLRLARAGKLTVIRYMIYNRRMWSAENGWKQQAYDGPSPHTEHLHLSGAYSQSADENASFNFHLDDLVGDDMASISQADFNARMDAWWLARMPATAPENKVRASLRLAPWQQEVGKTGVSTHSTLFGAMKSALDKLASEGTADEATLKAISDKLDLVLAKVIDQPAA